MRLAFSLTEVYDLNHESSVRDLKHRVGVVCDDVNRDEFFKARVCSFTMYSQVRGEPNACLLFAVQDDNEFVSTQRKLRTIALRAHLHVSFV